MPGYDDTPKTRTEQKRSGKKDKGPYSARHVRAAELRVARQRPPAADAEALAERRQAAGAAPKPPPKKK